MAHGDVWQRYEALFASDPLLLADDSQDEYAASVLENLLLNRTTNAFLPKLVDVFDAIEREKFLWRDDHIPPAPSAAVIRRYRRQRKHRAGLTKHDRDILQEVTMVSRGEFTEKRKGTRDSKGKPLKAFYPGHADALAKTNETRSKIENRLRIAAVGYRVQVSKVVGHAYLQEELVPRDAAVKRASDGIELLLATQSIGLTAAPSAPVNLDWSAAIISHLKAALGHKSHVVVFPEFALPHDVPGTNGVVEEILEECKAPGHSDFFLFGGSRHEGIGNHGLVVRRCAGSCSPAWWHSKVIPARTLGENIAGPFGSKRPSYVADFAIAKGRFPTKFPIDVAICYDSFDPTMFLMLILQSLVSTDDEVRPRIIIVPSYNTSRDFVAMLRDLSFLARSIVIYVNGLHGDAKMYICGFAIADFADEAALRRMLRALRAQSKTLMQQRADALNTVPIAPSKTGLPRILKKRAGALDDFANELKKLKGGGGLQALVTVYDKAHARGRYEPTDLLFYNVDMALINAVFEFRADYFGDDEFLPAPFRYKALKGAARIMQQRVNRENELRENHYQAYAARKGTQTG